MQLSLSSIENKDFLSIAKNYSSTNYFLSLRLEKWRQNFIG